MIERIVCVVVGHDLQQRPPVWPSSATAKVEECTRCSKVKTYSINEVYWEKKGGT